MNISFSVLSLHQVAHVNFTNKRGIDNDDDDDDDKMR